LKKRIIATILSIALMITQVPWAAMGVFAQTSLDIVSGSQIADPDTTNDWVNYFGKVNNQISTEYAGGVWTDKSVFAGNKTLDGVSFTAGENNFLVATSAISSTKQITGFEYLPTDTVFVLDVSGSMSASELQDMVEAANKAITKLLALNRYNRVGVVAYNPDVATLLTIDRYTSSKTDDNGTQADATDDYNIYIEYENGQLRTARIDMININANWNAVADLYTGNSWGGSGNTYGSAKYFFRNNDAVWTLVQQGIPTGVTFTRDNWRSIVNNADTGNGYNEINSESEWLEYFRNNAHITLRDDDIIYNVTGSDNVAENNTKSTGDGTFTQLGIYQARTLFEAMEGDTTIDTGYIQGGTKRMPIMVLMTDGAPTYGKSDYTFAADTARDMGNGSDVTYGLAFITQLTATHALTRMEQVYDREGLFYTLGLGVEESEAASVLDPANNTTNITELKNLWDDYDSPGQNQFIFTYTTQQWGYSYPTNVYRKETNYDPVAGTVSVSEMKGNFPYADKYFPATNSDGLVAAFDKIVQEIIVQSAYYPTLVTTGEYDMDGYVTLVDELGEYMEVKEIEGLLYGNTLFTGEKLIAGMYNGTYGNASTWTELGWELVYSIRERLEVAATGDNTDDDTDVYGTPIDVTNSVVTSLLSQAWQDGQIGGTYSDNGTPDNLNDDTATDFSNYVSYYVNAKGQYLGFHDKDHTSLDYPKGTKYIGRSYIFSGNITGEHSSIENTEMLHVVVQVYEDVTNGHQTVTWRVPASLIPTALYEIQVDGNQLTSESIQSVKYTSETPIRLVYEVGLNDVLTPVNINEILTAEGAHAHPTGDGRYYFYSNRWGDGHGVTELDPNKHKATVAHYNPSVENERYYFTEDTILYVESNGNYVPYTGAARPADKYPADDTKSGYYRPIHVIEATLNDAGTSTSKPTIETKWVSVAAAVLNDTNATKQATDGTNNWYVSKGTIYQQTARDRVYKDDTTTAEQKDGNFTDTLEYVDYPRIEHPTDNDTDYEVFLFHGNNGRLTVEPATGLKLTKDVDVASAEQDAKDLFKFVITLSQATSGVKVTKPDYSDYTHVAADALDAKYEYNLSADSKTITLLLADGETVYISNLTNGTTYTVTEDTAYNEYYVIKSVAAETVTDNVASGAVELTKIDEVAFVNTAASFKGNLQISKTVTHPYGDDYAMPDKVFDVVVTLKDRSGNLITDFAGLAIAGTVNNGTEISAFPIANTDGATSFTLQLGHEDSVTITGLPHGATYKVEESALPAGFTNTTSAGLDGTIVTDQTAYAHLVNSYAPVEYPQSTDLDLVITKVLGGKNNSNADLTWADIPAGSKFEFLLEKYNPATGAWDDTGRTLEILRDGQTVTANTATVTRDGTVNPVTFSYLGTHYYRVSEKTGTIEGITYDATHAYFRVIVTDADMDGYPEYTVQEANNTTLTELKEDAQNPEKVTGYQVNAQFTNRYNSTVANINIHKNLVNDTGVDIAMDNFTFVLCTSANCTGDSSCTAAASHTEVKPNINGDVIIPKTYTKGNVTITGEPTIEYSTFDETTVEYVIGTDPLKATKSGTVTAKETRTGTLTDKYYLTEVNGGMAGMTYATGNIPVEITVTATETYTYDSTITINYTGTEVPVVDDAGNPVYVQQTDGEGNLVVDGEGNPVYVQKTEIKWTKDGDPSYTERPTATTPTVTLASSVKYNNDAALTAATFSNTFTALPATATISGEKTFNRDITAGQFTFNLYESDSTFAVADNAAVKDTATVDAAALNGATATDAFNFDEISYDRVGTYYYVVKEAMPAGATEHNNYTVNGITYDQTVYHVTVTVSLSAGTNQLVADVNVKQGGSNAEIAFNNTYSITQGTSATLQVNKALTGRALAKDEFTFSLYKTDAAFAVADGATAEQTVGNSAYNTVNGNKYTGVVQFAEIPYSQPGTYYYVIKENIPASAVDNAYQGVAYTTTAVNATVVVVDNGDGTLKVESVTYTSDATFSNTYTPTPASVTVKGAKYYASNDPYEAKDVGTNVFKFALYPANDKYEVTSQTAVAVVDGVPRSGAKGYVDFAMQFGPYTSAGDYYYVLREIDGGVPTISYDLSVYHVNVTVTDNGVGQLSAVPHVYLEGQVAESRNDDGTYDIVRNPNVNWDFQNLYYPQQARAGVQVTKLVTNPSGAQLDKEGYEFALYRTATDNIDNRSNYVIKAVTDKDGNAYLEMTYDDTVQPGNYTYYLAEIIPEGADETNDYTVNGMKYSTDVYVVTITVGWEGNVLKAHVAENFNKFGTTEHVTSPITITNIYDLDEAKITLTAEKVLTDRNLGNNEFSFELYEATVDATGNWVKGNKLDTKFNTGKDITFNEQSYAEVGTYYYIIEEVVPADADKLVGVTYDTTQHRVTVSVSDNGAGALEAEVVEINGNAPSDTNKVVFVNDFDPTPIEVVISGVKKLYNRNPLDGEFSFALYLADEHYEITSGTAIATVANRADGTFEFTNDDLVAAYADALKFTETATKYFVVKEVMPADADKDPTITYSTFEHNIEVDVTKRNDGQLIYTVTDESGTSEDLVVENTYTSKRATATVNLSKTLTNETNTDPGVTVKDFTFGLYTDEACTVAYERNSNHVTVSPDDETGNFDTAAINLVYTDADYNAAKVYTYYLKEIIPADADKVLMMDYDKSVYKVVVTLSYDAHNNLVATPVITKIKDANGSPIAQANQQAVSTADFDNVYDLGSTAITLEGTKVYEGWTHDNEVFKFELYQTGASGNYAATGSKLIGTATVDKNTVNHKFTFTSENATSENTDNAAPQLSFTKAGTYYFAVRENQGGLTDLNKEIIYSGTQYVVAVKVSEKVENNKVTGLKAEKVVYHYGNKPDGLDSADSFAGFTSDNIRFTNIDLDGEATISFVGKKTIENANMADYDQAFDFVLYEADVDGNTWNLVDSKPDTAAIDPLISTENREDAAQQENDGYNIEFIGVPLEYTQDGDHTYQFVVKEVAASHPTITYDDTEYRITVTGGFTTDTSGNHIYNVTGVNVNGSSVQPTTNEGNIYVLAKENSSNTFENTYTSYNATAEIPVEKVLRNSTGAAMGEDGFVFGVYTDEACNTPYNKANGEQVTATTGSDGKATISLDYTDKDVSVTPHVYYIKEMYADKDGNPGADTIHGMTYSQQVYKVEVTVAFEKTATGYQLKATPVISTVDPASGVAAHTVVNKAEFTNTYRLDPATLAGFIGKKVMDSRAINSYEFRLELYNAKVEAPNNTVVATNGVWEKASRIEEVANTDKTDAAHSDYDKFQFSELTFDKAGEYYFIMVEQNGVVGGVTYDESAYQITVKVAPDATDDKLTATVTKVQKVTYTEDAQGNKTSAVATIYSADVQNPTGTFDIASADTFVFTNKYNAKGVLSLTGTKEIVNRGWRTGDEFTFELYETGSNYVIANNAAPVATDVVTASTLGSVFNIETVIECVEHINKVPQIGKHYFVLKEKAGDDSTMIYDTTEYHIYVETTDDLKGNLAVEIKEIKKVNTAASVSETVTADEIEFINTYNTVPVQATIIGTKELTGSVTDRQIKDGEFTFELYTVDNGYRPVSVVDEVKNDGNSFKFESDALKFTAAGEYYFMVKEKAGHNAIVTYDTTEYIVCVKVEEADNTVTTNKVELKATVYYVDQRGALTPISAELLKFSNKYNDMNVEIAIHKNLTVTGDIQHTLGGFEFQLKDVTNNVTFANSVSDNNGNGGYVIPYDEDDIGKVYEYELVEINKGERDMVYDTTVHKFKVEIMVDGGKLIAEITQNGVAVNNAEVYFNNTYNGNTPKPDSPKDPGKVVNTGDTTSNTPYIALMGASAAGLIAVLFLMKKKKDEEDEAEA